MTRNRTIIHALTLIEVRDALTKAINDDPDAARWDWYTHGDRMACFGTSFATLLEVRADEPEGGAA